MQRSLLAVLAIVVAAPALAADAAGLCKTSGAACHGAAGKGAFSATFAMGQAPRLAAYLSSAMAATWAR